MKETMIWSATYLTKKKLTIGVVGHNGMVGGTVYRYFKKNKTAKVYGYSLKDNKKKAKVLNADVIFICVPTPFDWKRYRYDDTAVFDTAAQITKKNALVVVKSTVMIGTIERLQKQFPNLLFFFNPEFLSESSCDTDFANPDRQFVGYTDTSYTMATFILHLLPLSPFDAIMPSKEAELLKYINNLHGIMEVMESNHYYDVCQKEGLDYERVIKAAMASKWMGVPMGRHYRKIFHKGYRGIGGKCFPKDLHAWIEYCMKKGIDVTIFKAAAKMNGRILADQQLSIEKSERL